MAYNVTGINTQYVDENKVELLTAMILGAPSLDEFHKVPNVKGPFNLHVMKNTVNFQNGSSCGFNADGTTTYSQRQLVPQVQKVNMEWCHKTMLQTFAEYEVNVKAGDEKIAHEQRLMEDISARIARKLEGMIWTGNHTSNTEEFDGIYTILNAAATTNKVNFTTSSLTTWIGKVKAVYLAIPEESLEKSVIYMNRGDFRAYIQELTDANMYHYAPTDKAFETIIPGTATRIVAYPGVPAGKIFSLVPDEVYFGFDNEDGYSTLDFWYSKDNDTFRLNVQWIAGVQVAFPEYTVLGE